MSDCIGCGEAMGAEYENEVAHIRCIHLCGLICPVCCIKIERYSDIEKHNKTCHKEATENES